MKFLGVGFTAFPLEFYILTWWHWVLTCSINPVIHQQVPVTLIKEFLERDSDWFWSTYDSYDITIVGCHKDGINMANKRPADLFLLEQVADGFFPGNLL